MQLLLIIIENDINKVKNYHGDYRDYFSCVNKNRDEWNAISTDKNVNENDWENDNIPKFTHSTLICGNPNLLEQKQHIKYTRRFIIEKLFHEMVTFDQILRKEQVRFPVNYKWLREEQNMQKDDANCKNKKQ